MTLRRGSTMRSILAAFFVMCASSAAPADGLTESQKIGMFLHGNWTWSINKCAGITRNKRYWRFLKENGKFTSFKQIYQNVDGKYFKQGWDVMQRKSDLWGSDEACDYAMEKWPAMLWRRK